MTDRLLRRFVEVMIKHFPPGAAELKVLDVGGRAGALLHDLRKDLRITEVAQPARRPEPNQFDSVVILDSLPSDEILARFLASLRPGGRLIVVDPAGEPDEKYAHILQRTGYVRFLIEYALATERRGVLIRGEKPHVIADTMQRIQQVARQDADQLNPDHFTGRYIHLLIRQSPNKPVWKLAPGERLKWEALAIQDNEPKLLGFSSLPKSVGFMQDAIMKGLARDIHKIAKFRKETMKSWSMPVLLNPTTLALLEAHEIVFVAIDPDTAEAPDE